MSDGAVWSIIFVVLIAGFILHCCSWGNGYDAGKRSVVTDSAMRLKLSEIRHIVEGCDD